jgi:hypothetical protein
MLWKEGYSELPTILPKERAQNFLKSYAGKGPIKSWCPMGGGPFLPGILWKEGAQNYLESSEGEEVQNYLES